MNTKGTIYVLVSALVVVFAVANRELLLRPVDLNLLVVHLQTPVAVLLLLVAAVILLLDFGVHAANEHAWIRERRALVRDLEAARQRAAAEDESRITALKSAVEKECAILRGQLDRVLAAQSTLLGRTSAPPANGTTARSGEVIEPELIPPRSPDARGAH